MIWAQRRDYSGIFIEQSIVAFILMLSIVSLSEAIRKYRSPGMLNVDNTVFIGYSFQKDAPPEEMIATRQSMDVILEHLKQLPYVEAITSGYNLAPYVRPENSYFFLSDSIHVDDKSFLSVLKMSDEYGDDVFKLEMEEGSWIEENRPLPDGSTPIVVSRAFVEKAGWTKAAGKKVMIRGKENTIMGVVSGLKQTPFIPSPAAAVIPNYILSGDPGSASYSENIARIKKGKVKDFMRSFNQEFHRLITDTRAEPIIINMEILKKEWVSFSFQNVILQAIPSLFLFFFACIGTFGLYHLIARKRLKEFALRLALGAEKKHLISLVVSESMVVTALAVFPALLLSFFIYEYTLLHIFANGIMLVAMLLFSFISAWYPAWKVSNVNPSEALQYE
jgi:ABC-type antimicrobial peptide transport system permease subunit